MDKELEKQEIEKQENDNLSVKETQKNQINSEASQALKVNTDEMSANSNANGKIKKKKREKPIGGYVLFSFASLNFGIYLFFASMFFDVLINKKSANSISDGIGAFFQVLLSTPGLIAFGVIMGVFSIFAIVNFATFLAESDENSVKKPAKVLLIITAFFLLSAAIIATIIFA